MPSCVIRGVPFYFVRTDWVVAWMTRSPSPPCFSAFPSLLFSILFDETELYQQSCQEFPEVSPGSYSSDQILVSQPLAGRALNKAVDPLRRVPLHITLIEAKGELIDIAVHVLRADMVESSVNATLENGKETFDAVRRHVTANELGSSMIDRLMGKPIEAMIGRKLIGMDCRAGFNVIHDFIMDHVAVCRLDRRGPGTPAALPHSENGGFPNGTAPSTQLLVSVLVSFLPANVGFVDFNYAAQLFELVAASLAKPSENEPCGFLCDADLFRKLHRRDALACSDDEVHRVNPLMQRNVRPLEDRASANREIRLALVAAVVSALARGDTVADAAGGAARALRPEPTFQVDATRLLIGEHFEKLVDRNGGLAHGPIPSFWADDSESLRGSKVYKFHF